MFWDNTEIIDQGFDARIHGYPDEPAPHFAPEFLEAKLFVGDSLRKVVCFGYLLNAAIQIVLPAMKATAQVRRIPTSRVL
jgi:hypothetical protein